MKRYLYAIMLMMLLLMVPRQEAWAASVIEVGTKLEETIKVIPQSPFYLDYQDGKTRLHDPSNQSTVVIDFPGNLTTHSSGDEGSYGGVRSWIASLDRQEWIAVPQYDQPLIRVQRDGTTSRIDSLESPHRADLVSYDASRDVMLWRDSYKNEWALTDLKGTVKRTYPLISGQRLILGTHLDELIAFNTSDKSITHLSLETGEERGKTPFPNESLSINFESKTDRLFMKGSNHLYVYDFATRTIQTLNLNRQVHYDITSLVYHDGLYYGVTFNDSMVTIDLTEGRITETSLRTRNTNSEFDLIENGYFVQDDQWLLPIERFGQKPKEMYTWLKATGNSEEGHTWLNHAYQLMATITTVDGTEHKVPVAELPTDVTQVESAQPFTEGYTIPSFDQSFSTKVSFAMLDHWKSYKPVKQLPLQLDTSFNYGAVGDITGMTAPNATVYLFCEKELYSTCSGSVQADETGRFTLSRGIITGGQSIELFASDSRDYRQATEASVKQKIVLAQPIVTDPTKVLTATRMEGVSVQTAPYAKVEVRQINSKTEYEVKEVQADEHGVAQLTTFDHSQPLSYPVFFRILGTEHSYEMTYVTQIYPVPSFTWTKPPKTGDTTITVYNDKLDPVLAVSRDGRAESAKRLTKGLNVINLKEPLREGQTIKLVASFLPEYTKTLEQKVTSETPKVLTVKDVLLTSSSATFTLVHDLNTDIYFTTSSGTSFYSRVVGTNRYHISAKPGTTVVIHSAYGSKKKTLTYKLPSATIPSVTLTDEQTKRVGKTLPNATVTLKNGSKVIATTKSNASGSYTLTFSRSRAGTKLYFEAKSGIHRDAKSVVVKSGIRPTISTGTIRSTTKSVAVRTNVPYGKLYVYNGSKLVAKKSIGSTTTNVYIGTQRRGTKLTFKVVTPANRTNQTTKSVY
ncbi:hypothetical protein LPB41_09820 [Thalassospira sp. MA62]|nr:hypothetical protein [Thalassospira sp. MA62]